MPEPAYEHPHLIYPVGTQVVVLRDVLSNGGRVLHHRGAVGMVVAAPADREHAYRVRFPDGLTVSLPRSELMLLARYQAGDLVADQDPELAEPLFDRVIYRCIIGSRAYGLEGPDSDTDRRGFYLPTAEWHWSLHGVPDQLEQQATQEAYWELQKFLTLALKANPNVLECLYSPLVELATPLAQELLAMRQCFLSRLVYQTYNGYVMSQFKKMQADLRNYGQVKWKHVMHLLRLLLSGIGVLQTGEVPVRVAEHRDQLLAIKHGEVSWTETERWRQALHAKLDAALQTTLLPERPDYDRVNAFLLRARRAALSEELP